MTITVIADDDLAIKEARHRPSDLLIALGDIQDSSIVMAAQACACNRILAVKGNHDSPVEFSDDIEDLHGRVVTINRQRIGGFCGSWKYKPRGAYLFTQEEVNLAMQGFPPVDILITHNSPTGVHERDITTHQGFDAFLAYIKRVQPRFALHGHQHMVAATQVGTTMVLGVYGVMHLTL